MLPADPPIRKRSRKKGLRFTHRKRRRVQKPSPVNVVQEETREEVHEETQEEQSSSQATTPEEAPITQQPERRNSGQSPYNTYEEDQAWQTARRTQAVNWRSWVKCQKAGPRPNSILHFFSSANYSTLEPTTKSPTQIQLDLSPTARTALEAVILARSIHESTLHLTLYQISGGKTARLPLSVPNITTYLNVTSAKLDRTPAPTSSPASLRPPLPVPTARTSIWVTATFVLPPSPTPSTIQTRRSPTPVPNMERMNEVTQHDFGLRPKPLDRRVFIRLHVPIVPIEAMEVDEPVEANKTVEAVETAQPPVITSKPSPIGQDEGGNITDASASSQSSSSSSTKSRDATDAFTIPTNATSSSSRTLTPSPPSKRQRIRILNVTKPRSTSSDESPPSVIATMPSLPPTHPLNRASRDLWREGSKAVRRSDGAVNDADIINWLMTRKGGINAPWPKLENNQRAVEAMGKDTIDFEKIYTQQAEKEQNEKEKEGIRLANKRRYRPRSEWAKEKAAKQAAAEAAAETTTTAATATLKRPREDMESTGADREL
ncbi:hypothetical protein B0J13DRAFT_654905 [Dactylonectria estremocensis]|uniref:Uncharacterized protein n=1 Tax=Dactylonectria estremocensis TaxID=1079267 RepID=A0A9P9F486_9HYPO|nr:hypothetical protein B0J13DRAFT_654905 [Dactylonectria estremocensis]